MAISKREQILSRLMEILATMSATMRGETASFATIARNRGELLETKRPALVLYDGTESVEDAFLAERKPARATRLVTMSPQIAVVLDDREPQNEMTGEDLNANVHAVSNAIEADDVLAGLVGPNGSVQYVGIDAQPYRAADTTSLAFFTMAITYARRHEPPAA